ncbi:lipid A deacylase LpxR family protein [Limihaloglobus sulfuriphilus]|nr:lipid A deacylase LpxR family protein [Limihaloglobus sulfuriphilus]
MIKTKAILTAIIVFMSVFPAAGESLNLYLQNDSKILKPNHNTDRHYTNGFKLAWVTKTPDWQLLDYFGGWAFASGAEPLRESGVYIAQDLYTPDYIDMPNMRPTPDMKYNAWLYGGFFNVRSNSEKLEYIELNMGVIGPSALGESIQKPVHEITGSPKPIGWDEQLSDEFAINLDYYIRQKLTDAYELFGYDFDILADYGLTVGSVFRHAEAGMLMRLGIIKPGELGPGRYRLPIDGTAATSKSSSYLFGRISGRGVEHNRFLTGLKEEPLTAQAQLGIVINIKDFDIKYSQTFFTDQYENQHAKDSIASLTVSWNF